MADTRLLQRQLNDILNDLGSETYTLSGIEQLQNKLAEATGLAAQIRYELESETMLDGD